ncbi:MAG: flavodoxin domain-containing protein [Bacteroidota bacterium]
MNQEKNMLAGPKQTLLTGLTAGASREELIWISGYIAALIEGGEKDTAIPEPVVAVPMPQKITLVYGTETGNSKRVATELAAKAKKKQLQVKLASLDQYRLTDLTKEENLFVVISTQGDGEPPVAAQKFYDHIHRNGFRLEKTKYSVLALGDTSYPMFCKTGEDVDAQLEKLGGKRIVPIRKCDVDYEADADTWFEEVIRSLSQTVPAATPSIKVQQVPDIKSNKLIYTGTVLSHINLHDTGSSRETYHIELSAEGVDYLPGDSIAMVPENNADRVEEILSLTGIDRTRTIPFKESTVTVYDLLRKKIGIVFLHERVIKKYAAVVQQEIPEVRMDLFTLLQLYPVKNTEQFEEVLKILPAQSPRIYTIASSPSTHTGEIHLTVEKDVFEINGTQTTGLCSAHLSQVAPGSTIEFFIQRNKRFRLPAPEKDLIMIGPGTGIAAFRSFISERDATGASGKNWLFFGEEDFVTDFLYQTEIQDWHQTGVLSKVSLAFSKSKSTNIMVQHKLLEHGKEIFNWIESGAHLYVCGQKTPMSLEVESALLGIIERFGGYSAKETQAYFDKMKEEGRYSKDVY